VKLLKVVLIGLLVGGGYVAPSYGTVYAFSYFDLSAEGWIARDDRGGLAHNADGGYPGGYVSTTVSEDTPYTYLVAPSTFLGDKSAALGGELRLDLRLNLPMQPDGPYGAVFLERDGRSIFHKIDMPGQEWTAYSFGLDGQSDWTWTVLAQQATTEDLSYFLSDLDGMYIERVCQPNGFNGGDLDNVELIKTGTDSIPEVPEPSVIVLLIAASGFLLLTRRRKRSA